MRIRSLTLKNIGPFKEADLEFISNDYELDSPPIICITGENGTGKSIIIDSIRSILTGRFHGEVERDIVSSDSFLVDSIFHINNKNVNIKSTSKYQSGTLDTNNMEVNKLFHSNLETSFIKDFVFDYWTSKLSNDKFEITNITTLQTEKYLDNTLSGVHKNVDLTKAISFFDYLKDSKDEKEKILGTELYTLLEEIINISISSGKLSHVSRINLKPIIKIGTKELSLDKLSSGNLYLIQRFVNLISQIYSICVINNIPISEYKSIKGLIIIDEAENHLHPKWQKVFLGNILKLFPKLQLIVSTHSPFIVSSVKNCKVFVCKSNLEFSTIKEETDFYSNKPIEEILLSPLFDTRNFNSEISDLLQQRKLAHENKNHEELERIEKKLIEINPEYFNYLNIEQIIKSIKK